MNDVDAVPHVGLIINPRGMATSFTTSAVRSLHTV